MKELEVGMYVRTKDGKISKIKDINNFIYTDKQCYGKHYVIKSSHNPIDLIEEGDYVNGLLVIRILEDNETKEKYINLYGSVSEWEEEDIKSIVTKEQFESMKYEVKE